LFRAIYKYGRSSLTKWSPTADSRTRVIQIAVKLPKIVIKVTNEQRINETHFTALPLSKFQG
jgi:hypothetical protein